MTEKNNNKAILMIVGISITVILTLATIINSLAWGAIGDNTRDIRIQADRVTNIEKVLAGLQTLPVDLRDINHRQGRADSLLIEVLHEIRDIKEQVEP